MRYSFNILLTLLFCLVAPLQVQAKLNIFACEPEWAALATDIGQNNVTAYSATTALQDPHYIQARPSLIAKMRRADLVLCSGAQLEIGWLPMLLKKANNRDVMQGTQGYFEASSFVARRDATTNVDRSQGDIHPQGNPHVQTDPHNMLAIAQALSERLSVLDPANRENYESGLDRFQKRWRQSIQQWELKAKPLRGKRVITHHKSWVYLIRWLGLIEVANLEAISGVPPTAGHLSELVARFSSGEADFIVRSPFQNSRASEWLSKRTNLPVVMLPLTVGGTHEATDLIAMFDDIVNRLLAASQ